MTVSERLDVLYRATAAVRDAGIARLPDPGFYELQRLCVQLSAACYTAEMLARYVDESRTGYPASAVAIIEHWSESYVDAMRRAAA